MTATMTSDAFLQSQRDTVRVVDRIGGRRQLRRRSILGFVSGRDLEATLKLAVAAGALKQSMPGNFNHVSGSAL